MFPQVFSNFGACKLRVFQQSCVILLRNLFLYFTMKQFILALFVLIFAGQLSTAAQKKVLYGVAFYNVENLFDTNHDAGKKDYDFLPTGSYQWTENKYQSKLSNMAQVISELCTEVGTTQCPAGAAVVGLSEVENARVLGDLLQQPSLAKRGYKAIHFEGPDRRGIDVAMLYNPKAFHLESAMLVPFVYRDSLQPNVDLGFYQGADGKIQPYSNKNGELIGDTTYTTRGFLTVGGKLGGEKFYFIVNHWPSRGAQSPVRERAGYQVRKLKEALLAQDPGARIVIMGDLNDDPNNASVDAPESLGAKHKESDVTSPDDLYNPWWDMLYNKGIGTLYYRGKWNLFDQIIFSAGLLDKSQPERLHLLTNAVFSRDYLLQQEGKYKGTPKRTTAGGVWINGYSDHLPTQIFLVKDAK